ncbi:MAG: helix-turn-helix transcriptional regulator [Desulfovibrionaceae bacterium]|nr:helix-turn-helix transcriptional regulator [Desulfovibrionaceae bacterium]
MPTFGPTIRKLREGLNKSMKDLANLLGVSVVYISDIERGRRNPPQGEKLHKIAEFLSVSPEEVET